MKRKYNNDDLNKIKSILNEAEKKKEINTIAPIIAVPVIEKMEIENGLVENSIQLKDELIAKNDAQIDDLGGDFQVPKKGRPKKESTISTKIENVEIVDDKMEKVEVGVDVSQKPIEQPKPKILKLPINIVVVKREIPMNSLSSYVEPEFLHLAPKL
jgi:hypothetical protein